MPTSAFVTPLGRTPPAALTGQQLGNEAARQNPHLISPLSFNSIGVDQLAIGAVGAYASATYPTASLAVAVPFEIAASFLVRKVWWVNGTTVGTDSADVGVYTEAGARLVAGGGTLTAGANIMQEVDVSDTFLKPGRYWLAYVQNGTTATPRIRIPAAALCRVMGMAQMSTAYPLPSTFTPAAMTVACVPMMGIASRTLAV